MSEISNPPPNHNLEDDLIRAQIAMRDSLVSLGAISPEDAEELTVPLQERIDLRSSGKFMAFEEELASSPELTAELRKLDNEQFKEVLIDAGVVSQALYDSGLLDRFAGDDLVPHNVDNRKVYTPMSGLKHIFLGDLLGGLHDYDSMEKSGLAGPETDTHPTKWKSGHHDTRVGNFNTIQPVDIDGDGTIDEHIDHQLYTKTQFPEKWTADDVLLAIIDVSETPAISKTENGDEESSVHVGEVNGILLRVICGDGKIKAGYPIKQSPAHRDAGQESVAA